MNNFQDLKSRLQKFNGKNIVVSTVGMASITMGLEKCIVMDYIGRNTKGINICNVNNVLDGENPISVNVKENCIQSFEVTECDGNSEVTIELQNGETVIIVGCGI